MNHEEGQQPGVSDVTTRVIELSGEVDLYTAPEFSEHMVALIESGAEHIVVDLSQAVFLDESPIFGVLAKTVKSGHVSVAIVLSDESIRRVFEITGLDRVFSIYSSREEAVAAVLGDAQESARRVAPASRGVRSHPTPTADSNDHRRRMEEQIKADYGKPGPRCRQCTALLPSDDAFGCHWCGAVQTDRPFHAIPEEEARRRGWID